MIILTHHADDSCGSRQNITGYESTLLNQFVKVGSDTRLVTCMGFVNVVSCHPVGVQVKQNY